MLINSISASNIYNSRQNPQNFKGLWGKTTEISDRDAVLGVNKVEDIAYYYPFMGETKDHIKEVITQNSRAGIEDVDGVPVYKIESCRVCTVLPCTESEYQIYSQLGKNAELVPNVLKIHEAVKDKYTTREYSTLQKSAVNPIIEAKVFNSEA